MEEREWYEEPRKLLMKEDWPPQRSIKYTPISQKKEKVMMDILTFETGKCHPGQGTTKKKCRGPPDR